MMNKIKTFRFHIFTFCVVLFFYYPKNVEAFAQVHVGDSFPSWSDGYLDIHHINTGKGESSFFILPDGTTMLVDAGVALTPKPRATDAKPNDILTAGEWTSRYIIHRATDAKPNDILTPGEWTSRYIIHMMLPLKERELNFILLSHFHLDHLGGLSPDMPTSKSGAYKLSGITEVGENIPFKKIIDRNWPDYNWPVPLKDDMMKNYIQFLKWNIEKKSTVVEQFKVGKNNQLVLVHNPDKYPNFEIRNIAANGHVWSGFGSNEQNHFPDLKDLNEKDYPTENKCSIAFRLSYGKFDYFSGGDIDVRGADTGGASDQWKDIETPIAQVTGPVEVLKANHHANYDANSVSFLQILRPRVIIIDTWLVNQPDFGIWRRMISTETYSGPRDIYATNIMGVTKIVMGEEIDKMRSQQGHIVIRVNPGGATFMIYTLDDSKENYMIKSMNGPYLCR